MRVHPGFLAPKRARWQYPAAFALLLFLLVMNILRGPKEAVVAKEMPPVKVNEVIVAKSAFSAGEPLSRDKLVIERRSVNSLPVDAIGSFAEIEGMVAAGPIPAGYPLAKVLVGKPVPIAPVSDDAASIDKALDPVEALIQSIIPETVALPVNFAGIAPKRGSRVALAISNHTGDTVLILDAAWVSDSSGSSATLRVPPAKALYVQSVMRLGNLTYIEIPTEGASPYSGHAVENMNDLQVALGLIDGPKKSVVVSSDGETVFRSYAWVKGTSMRYGIDDRGLIYVVDDQGRKVAGPVITSMK